MLRNLELGTSRRAPCLEVQSSTNPAYCSQTARQHDFESFKDLDRAKRVLRSLIEDFGGEATSSSLVERIAVQEPTFLEKETRPLTAVQMMLAQLESCGALTLEALDGTEVIARIAPTGATLAYEQAAAERACEKD